MTNKGFVKHNVEKALKKKGFEDFDTESHVDAELGLKENLDNLENELGISLRKKDPNSADVRRGRRQSDMKQAEHRHEARPEDNQQVDENINAETMFEPPLSDREFDAWADNPDEYDVKGVDGGLFE